MNSNETERCGVDTRSRWKRRKERKKERRKSGVGVTRGWEPDEGLGGLREGALLRLLQVRSSEVRLLQSMAMQNQLNSSTNAENIDVDELGQNK